ncbi:hypothetical protein KCP77_14690 [Salmonella enterica subsp. enterica]|nr:hypothetical protein KCP77_14690 [Salmonella enterica subsp. enterica]
MGLVHLPPAVGHSFLFGASVAYTACSCILASLGIVVDVPDNASGCRACRVFHLIVKAFNGSDTY